MFGMGPWATIAGAGMATAGAKLLGAGYRVPALLALGIADPDAQRDAADKWQQVHDRLQGHPGAVDTALGDVHWEGESRGAFDTAITSYKDGVDRAAPSPRGTADFLRTSAGVYDGWSVMAAAVGGTMLTAGIMSTAGKTNPFTAAVARLAALGFGRRAETKTAQTAAETKSFLDQGGKVIAGGVKGLMAKPVVKVGVGVAGLYLTGEMVHTPVVENLKQTAIQDVPPGVPG